MGMPLGWHRRHAIILAGQLPDNTADALLVLEATKELVETFLVGHVDRETKAANILPFPA
jgi:Uma2 family endonuclease